MKQILLTATLIFSVNFNYSQIANQPSDLQLCDDFNNDGFASFDLTSVNSQINGSQNPPNSISFYTTQLDAMDNSNVITNPLSFTNTSNPQTIYARVTDVTTGNYNTTNFMIEVLSIPIANNPSPLEICDNDLDGFTVFDLESKNQEILNNQTNATISFYETVSNAENQINQIVNPSSYTNIISHTQTIYFRVDLSSSFCSTISELDLITLDCTDSDSDGVIDTDEDLNFNGNPNDDDTDMDNIANYLDEDDDNDGILTIDEDYNGNGDPTDDDTDNSDIPDYLEIGVALSASEFEFTKIRVYPNPSSETIYLNNLTNESDISIYDLKGRQINISIQRRHSNSTFEFNISSLNNGIYIIKVQNGNKEKSLKFVIKK